MTENEVLKKIMFALIKANDNYKKAFMSMLEDYVRDGVNKVYVHSFCEICPLQKSQAGGCSKDLGKDYTDTCAEEIFKRYVENTK